MGKRRIKVTARGGSPRAQRVSMPVAPVATPARPFRPMARAPWPRRAIPGSSANYWELDYDTINNMQWLVAQKDHSIPIFPEPHACVVGTVSEVLSEADGDTHIWLVVDGTSKGQLACELTPQQRIAPPTKGQHVRVYGIFRYDLQHSWPEIHPVDHWEPA